MYSLEYSRSALRSLRRMPCSVATLIRGKIETLAADPYARNNNVLKLQGRDGYRLRVGDWRVLYELRDDKLVIEVIDIKPRGGAYQ